MMETPKNDSHLKCTGCNRFFKEHVYCFPAVINGTIFCFCTTCRNKRNRNINRRNFLLEDFIQASNITRDEFSDSEFEVRQTPPPTVPTEALRLKCPHKNCPQPRFPNVQDLATHVKHSHSKIITKLNKGQYTTIFLHPSPVGTEIIKLVSFSENIFVICLKFKEIRYLNDLMIECKIAVLGDAAPFSVKIVLDNTYTRSDQKGKVVGYENFKKNIGKSNLFCFGVEKFEKLKIYIIKKDQMNRE